MEEITQEETETRMMNLLKSYLEQYCRKKRRKKALERRLQNFRAEMMGTKAIRYSQMPKSRTYGVGNEPLEFTIKCEEIEERIRKEQKAGAVAMLKVMDILDFLNDSKEKEILEYKYLDGYDWEIITKKMDLSKSRCGAYLNRGCSHLLQFAKIRKILEEYEKEIEAAEDKLM